MCSLFTLAVVFFLSLSRGQVKHPITVHAINPKTIHSSTLRSGSKTTPRQIFSFDLAFLIRRVVTAISPSAALPRIYRPPIDHPARTTIFFAVPGRTCRNERVCNPHTGNASAPRTIISYRGVRAERKRHGFTSLTSRRVFSADRPVSARDADVPGRRFFFIVTLSSFQKSWQITS